MPQSYTARKYYALCALRWQVAAEAHLNFTETLSPLGRDDSHSNDMKNYASKMLLEASFLGWTKEGKYAIQNLHANVNYRDERGYTPLHIAIQRKRLGTAEMLLQNGADANLTNKKCFSPLLRACADGFDKAIPVFAKYQVDFNKKITYRNWNKFYLGYKAYSVYPLTFAISADKPAVVKALLDHGACLDIPYAGGKTIREALLFDKREKKVLFRNRYIKR